MVEIGEEAPDFETEDESGNNFKLSDHRGEKIALAFYPKDFTPGCTAEMCSLRDGYEMFEDAGIEIFGISGGSAESHQEFREKHNLPFHLLMDKDLEIAEKYDAKSRLGVLGLGVKRVTYLINEEGQIEGIFGGDGEDKVKSSQHAKQISQFWDLKL